MATTVKFSEDIVPLGDMKVNPGKIVRRVDETGRPVLLTSHGRGVAVVQSLSDYEALQQERDCMRAAEKYFEGPGRRILLTGSPALQNLWPGIVKPFVAGPPQTC